MVIDKPIETQDSYRGDAGIDKPKMITPRSFRFASTKDERLREALERNAIFESSPTRRTLTMETSEKLMNLRPRMEHMEISRDFRFKATS